MRRAFRSTFPPTHASRSTSTTNRPPFRGVSSQDLLHKHITEKPVTPRQFNPDVTEDFAQLILRMLAKKKEDRPRDFHEVLMAMRGIKLFSEPAPA